jgi:cold shock CspA family protein
MLPDEWQFGRRYAGAITQTFIERGFFFARANDGPKATLFAHVRQMADPGKFETLEPGARIAFCVERDPRSGRLRAGEIEVLP